MNEFTPSFKTRLINKIDELHLSDLGSEIVLTVQENTILKQNISRLRLEVQHVISNIKSERWEIESSADLRDRLDEHELWEAVYTADIEAFVAEAGISECFAWFEDNIGESASSLNDLYSAVQWDLRNALIETFVNLAEEEDHLMFVA